MIAAIAAMVLGAPLSGSSGRWRAWRQSAYIRLMPVATPTLVSASIPAQSDPGADHLFPALRIVDDRDVEVPFAIDAVEETVTAKTLLPTAVRFVSGAYTEATFDRRTHAARASRFHIETPRRAFYEQASLETSERGTIWHAAPAQLIFRADGEPLDQVSLRTAPTRSRYVRVRILDPARTFDITGLREGGGASPAEAVLAEAQPVRHGGKHQTWLAIFNSRWVDLTGITFALRGGPFDRALSIEASIDGSTWCIVRRTDVQSFERTAGTIVVPFPQHAARYWRVTIENGDDAPLDIERVQLLGPAHTTTFFAQAGRRYRMLWDNATADPAMYDLGALLAREPRDAQAQAATVAAAAEAATPTRPLLDARFLSTAAMLAVAAGLMVGAVRILRETS